MAPDAYVERSEIRVLRVRADMKGAGPAGAMRALESKLPTLKGRKFYGAFRALPEGEEYFACVEALPSEDPSPMGLEAATLPGGLYVRRKVFDWESVIAEGRLGAIFQDMIGTYTPDPNRPELEFYRSQTELHLLLPVLAKTPLPGAAGPEGR